MKGMEAGRGVRLTHALGKGAFGEVWEAETPEGQTVALKFMECSNRSGRTIVNEIRLLVALRELRHPHLLELHSVSARRNYLVICMERAEGSLHDLHHAYKEETGGNIPPVHLCELLSQGAQALDFLAAQKIPGVTTDAGGLQHCDVKPRNLLLVGDILKVADFGLCTPQIGNGSRRLRIGTPLYSPPEFAEGKVTPRSDQFSLAISYCELRTGQMPISEEHKPGRLAPADLSGLSLSERPVIARALEPQWLARWPSCQAMMTALSEAVAASSATVALSKSAQKRL
jgi:serine/threonine-protein kinase